MGPETPRAASSLEPGAPALALVATLTRLATRAQVVEIAVDGALPVRQGGSAILTTAIDSEDAWFGHASECPNSDRAAGWIAAAPLTAPSGARGFIAAFRETPAFDVAVQDELRVAAQLVEETLDRAVEQHHHDELGSLLRATQHELGVTQRSLASSNEQLSQFASIAAHELGAPLRSLGVYADVLALRVDSVGDSDSVIEQCAIAIQQGVRTMTNDVTYLLELAKHDGDRGDLQVVDLREVAQDAISTLEPVINEVGATVTVDKLPVAVGRAAPLRAVIVNLVLNSIRNRHADRPLVVAITSSVSTDGCEIHIADNGRGFDLPTVSMPIDSRAPGIEGLGVGLDLCRRIVADCDGDLRVDTSRTSGACVVVSLRLSSRSQSN